jgi:hypothetical protein
MAMRAPANTAAMLELQCSSPRPAPRPIRSRVLLLLLYHRPYCALALAACKACRRRMNTQLAWIVDSGGDWQWWWR